MVASIQPACLVYRVQMRPAFIHPRIDISGRLANLKASANRSRNHIRFNHARFNSVQQQTLPAAFVADIFGRYPLRLRKWPNSSLGHVDVRTTEIYLRLDPSEKLEAVEAVLPPALRRGNSRHPMR